MTTARSEKEDNPPASTPHPEAAIVFGSAATGTRRKPASVRAVCEAIGLPRSTFYYQSHRSLSAIELEHRIVLRLHELREHFPHDGYRRMTRQLQLEGFHVNRKRIARLMQLHGLTTQPATPWCGVADGRRPPGVIPNRLQAARLTGPHQAWIGDIAYVHIRPGLGYAASIVDVWSREVVGYALSLQISNRPVNIALHSAVRARRPTAGCIHHSVYGTQYLMRGYRRLLREYGLTASTGAAEHAASSPAGGAGTCLPRQVIEMQFFETWDGVFHQAQEFIHAVYSRERVDSILQMTTGAAIPQPGTQRTGWPVSTARPALLSSTGESRRYGRNV